jgi:ribonuclease J
MFRGNKPTRKVYQGSGVPLKPANPLSNDLVNKKSVSTGRDAIRVVPLGGIGNVTKNMYVYEYRVDGVLRDILIVDCGVGFPEPDMYGVDLVIPDIRYLKDKLSYIRGLVFSHGHDDHIGGIPFCFDKIGRPPM